MELYIAKILYEGEGASVGFDDKLTFSDLCDKIHYRFHDLSKYNFGMNFTIYPDVTQFQLKDDMDMRLLFRVLDRESADFVDIKVHKIIESSLMNQEEDTSIQDAKFRLLDPNEYLGCYRRDDAKVYMSNSWKSYIDREGQIFEGGAKEFIMKLRMYAIEVGFDYDFLTNKAHRVYAVCSKKNVDGCKWFVKASLVRHNDFFVIYSISNVHQCSSLVRSRKSKMISSEIVKQVMLDKIRENPNAKAVEIQQDLKLNYGLDVPYHKAWYGKELAREEVLGVEADSYRQLKWFGELTCEANSCSRIAIECADTSESDNGNLRFKRMFVSYGVFLNDFQYCRPVLHVDATFITNKYRGMLLGATAKDSNCMYPVAYAIVDFETEDN